MKRTTLLAALMAVGVSGSALAQMGPKGPELEGVDHGRLMMLMKIAKLTPDQKAQAKQIMRQAHEQTKPLVQQIRALREQLTEKIVTPGSLQLSDFAPIRQQIRDLQIQVDDKALGAVVQVRALLKPDQMQRVADAHVKMKALHQQMEDLVGPPDEPGEHEDPVQ